jgi:hypothetical protein
VETAAQVKTITMPLSLFPADGPPLDALVRAPLMAGVRYKGRGSAENQI